VDPSTQMLLWKAKTQSTSSSNALWKIRFGKTQIKKKDNSRILGIAVLESC